MRRVTLFIAVAMLAALVAMVVDVGDLPGLQQRAFIFLFLLWLSLAIRRLARSAEASA